MNGAVFQALQDFISFLCLRLPRQIGHMDGKALIKLLKRPVMLSCQYLRRRHQGSLVPVLHNFRQRQRRHRRLAAAHVPLDETLHRDKSFHIILNVGKGLPLPFGQMKREIFKHRLHQFPGGSALDAHHMLLPLLPKEQDACLHEEKLLKRRAAAGFLLLLPVLRTVHGPGRLQTPHEMLPQERFRRQIFLHILHMVQGEGNHIPHFPDADALGQRIHRHQLLERRELVGRHHFDFRIGNLQLSVVIFNAAIGQHIGVLPEGVRLPGLVEIHQRHRAGAVHQEHIQYAHAPARSHQPHIRHFAVNDRLVIRPKFFHLCDFGPVLVTAGIEGNEILHRGYAKPRQLFLHTGPYALDILYGI